MVKGQVGPLPTADAVADELGVSAKTVKRNGERAQLHDDLLQGQAILYAGDRIDQFRKAFGEIGRCWVKHGG